MQALQALGQNLPQVWHAVTTTAADRKRILRFIIREVILDQKRITGQVWLKILWQTGATSEHAVQRRVHTYNDYADLDRLRQRITELNAAGKMDKEIAQILNQEGFTAARGCRFQGENVWLLRDRWGIATVKINGVAANPLRWPDGSYLGSGSGCALGRDAADIFDYLARGFLVGRQLRQRTALANRSDGRSDPVSAGSSTTHQTIKKGGIMKAPSERCGSSSARRGRSCASADPCGSGRAGASSWC